MPKQYRDEDGKVRSYVDAKLAAGSEVVAVVKGSSVVVGAVTFDVDGRVVHGLATDRPAADAMHAVLPFAYYNAVDTQALTQTDGSNWVVV